MPSPALSAFEIHSLKSIIVLLHQLAVFLQQHAKMVDCLHLHIQIQRNIFPLVSRISRFPDKYPKTGAMFHQLFG